MSAGRAPSAWPAPHRLFGALALQVKQLGHHQVTHVVVDRAVDADDALLHAAGAGAAGRVLAPTRSCRLPGPLCAGQHAGRGRSMPDSGLAGGAAARHAGEHPTRSAHAFASSALQRARQSAAGRPLLLAGVAAGGGREACTLICGKTGPKLPSCTHPEEAGVDVKGALASAGRLDDYRDQPRHAASLLPQRGRAPGGRPCQHCRLSSLQLQGGRRCTASST